MKISRFELGLLLLLLLAVNSCREDKSQLLNLDFEKIDSKTNKALGWRYYEKRYKASLDNKIIYSGKYSLKIEPDTIKNSIYNGATVCIIFDSIPINQKIRLTGFIKNEGTNCDTLGLFISYNAPIYDSGNELISKNFIGSHDWQEYSIEVFPEGPTDNIMFGVRMKGTGKIWVDNLRLYINDKRISKFPVQNSFKANTDELQWLKNHSIPIKTVHAENGFKDLMPLKESFKNARIIALGENTHGTSEIFEMKHRLLEFLASEMGYTIFTIESAMFNSDLLNDYVLTGKGNPEKLMSTLTGAWNTREVLDMIKWMRKYNETADKKIQFTGCDMQSFEGSLSRLSNFANHQNQTIKPMVDSLTIMLYKSHQTINESEIRKQYQLQIGKCDQILSVLNKSNYPPEESSKGKELSLAIQSANIIYQYLDLNSTGHKRGMRDKYMAENVSWILENNPNAKIVLWAHNEHVAKLSGMMGESLSIKYGNQYYSVGFLTNEGKYMAGLEKRISIENKLLKGEPGSFEYNFNKTGLSCFFFDLKQINKDEPNSLWLDKKLNQRTIGANATEYQFLPALLRKKFDAVIFINSTTPTRTFLPLDKDIVP